MKFKEGDTVYLKATISEVTEVEMGWFELYDVGYRVNIEGCESDVPTKKNIMYTKEEMLKYLNKNTLPKVGKQYRFSKNPNMEPFTVVHITESSIFYEYGHGTRGFVMDHIEFNKNCIAV